MALTKDIKKSFDRLSSKVEGIKSTTYHTNTSSHYIFKTKDLILSVDIEDCAMVGRSIKFSAMTHCGEKIGDKYYKLTRHQHYYFQKLIEDTL